MRNLKILFALSICCSLFLTACVKDGAAGATIASQVTGTFMSSNATIIVEDETVAESVSDYLIRIIEVDANTVSVVSEDISTFEVNLEKSDNGEMTTGKTDSGGSGFTFSYLVSEGVLNLKYSDGSSIIEFEGAKE